MSGPGFLDVDWDRRPVLDLDADPPPPLPAHQRTGVVSVRMTAQLRRFLFDQAEREGCSVNAWIVHELEKARDAALPIDVVDWLTMQAAQCGCPGDIDQALIQTVRHLAKRWPQGGRLRG